MTKTPHPIPQKCNFSQSVVLDWSRPLDDLPSPTYCENIYLFVIHTLQLNLTIYIFYYFFKGNILTFINK